MTAAETIASLARAIENASAAGQWELVERLVALLEGHSRQPPILQAGTVVPSTAPSATSSGDGGDVVQSNSRGVDPPSDAPDHPSGSAAPAEGAIPEVWTYELGTTEETTAYKRLLQEHQVTDVAYSIARRAGAPDVAQKLVAHQRNARRIQAAQRARRLGGRDPRTGKPYPS